MKHLAAALIALALFQPVAWAGIVTWTAGVSLNYIYDPSTGQTTLETSIVPGDKSGFAIFDFTNAKIGGAGNNYLALVNIQGYDSNSLTVHITDANWNSSQGDTTGIPLFVYQYPSSLRPPSQFDPPGRLMQTLLVSPGTTPTLTLDGVNDGSGTCFLLETQADVVDGAPYLAFDFDPPASDTLSVASTVPEPSSALLFAAGMVVVGWWACKPRAA